MVLQLLRDLPSSVATGGTLYWPDWTVELFTLEDVIRERFDFSTGRWLWKSEFKIPKKTAIPSGRYEVTITWSNHFNRRMPLLLDVPDYTGIRIHPGKDASWTDGCVLTGRARQGDQLVGYNEAFDAFFPKLEAALGREKVFINIVNTVLPTPDITLTPS
jgi:hypothetical protein